MRKNLLTLEERWAIDIAAAKASGTFVYSVAQCEICKYWIKGNALKCEKYIEKKPNETLRCKKECPSFEPMHKMEIKTRTTKNKSLLCGFLGLLLWVLWESHLNPYQKRRRKAIRYRKYVPMAPIIYIFALGQMIQLRYFVLWIVFKRKIYMFICSGLIQK